MPDTDDPWGNGGEDSGRHRPRASTSPLFGVDIHPTYQAGFSVDQAVAQGIGFLACKVSEGTWTYDSRAWLNRAQAIGLPAVGYHYLHPGGEDQQAKVFAAQLAAAGHVPGMLDAEALTAGTAMASEGRHDSGGMGQHPHSSGGLIRASEVRHARGAIPAATLTVTGIRTFLASAAKCGADVRALYLPHWYWQRMGSPGLSPLALPLWASSYPSNNRGTPAQLYPAVDPGRWAAYGGLSTAVLQFAQTGIAGGIQPVDLDAYLGTRAQLAALLGIQPTPRTSEDAMAIVTLPRTPAPNDLTDAPSTWPTTEEVVHLGWVQGWHGRVILRLAVGHPGGYLYRAHVDYPGPRVAPWIDPKAGQSLALDPPYRQAKEYVFEAPAGSGTLMITYAAPGGASLNVEYEH